MELSVIQSKIYELRGVRVMLDFDLAELYQVETRTLKQSIRRNMKRFPSDFMFEITRDEYNFLRSQFVILKNKTDDDGRGKHSKYLPFAFTEQGVAMLSSILHSDMAIDVNIRIMRAFVAIRTCLYEHASVSGEIAELRGRVRALEVAANENLKAVNDLSEDTGSHLDDIYIALSELSNKIALAESKPKHNPVGYTAPQYKREESK
jgi:hypothetical protein